MPREGDVTWVTPPSRTGSLARPLCMTRLDVEPPGVDAPEPVPALVERMWRPLVTLAAGLTGSLAAGARLPGDSFSDLS